MKTCSFLFAPILLCLLFSPQELHSQNTPKATIKGRVLDDSTNTPLPLANVFVAGTTIGVAADKEGRFELKGLGGDSSPRALRAPAGYRVDPDTLLHLGDAPFERKLTFFPEVLQIIYGRAHERHISLIELDGPSAIVYSNGLNLLGIETQGYWSFQRAAELLPSDYEPEQ